MAYCTLAQLTDRFGTRMLIDLTDRGEPATGAVVTTVVDRAIADTDALIDGHLATRYALPLASVPSLLIDLALQIAIYKLHAQVASEKITADYESALKMLKAISSGEIRIPAAGLEPASSGAQGVRTNDRERPFTEENLKGYI